MGFYIITIWYKNGKQCHEIKNYVFGHCLPSSSRIIKLYNCEQVMTVYVLNNIKNLSNKDNFF